MGGQSKTPCCIKKHHAGFGESCKTNENAAEIQHANPKQVRHLRRGGAATPHMRKHKNHRGGLRSLPKPAGPWHANGGGTPPIAKHAAACRGHGGGCAGMQGDAGMQKTWRGLTRYWRGMPRHAGEWGGDARGCGLVRNGQRNLAGTAQACPLVARHGAKWQGCNTVRANKRKQTKTSTAKQEQAPRMRKCDRPSRGLAGDAGVEKSCSFGAAAWRVEWAA